VFRPYCGPKTLLDVNIFDYQVNMAERNARIVGRSQLSERRREEKNGAGKGASEFHGQIHCTEIRRESSLPGEALRVPDNGVGNRAWLFHDDGVRGVGNHHYRDTLCAELFHEFGRTRGRPIGVV